MAMVGLANGRDSKLSRLLDDDQEPILAVKENEDREDSLDPFFAVLGEARLN